MAFIYDLADTWNDGATTFNGIRLNVTDTASVAESLLMSLQVGGANRFSVRKDGRVTASGDVLFSTYVGDSGGARVRVNSISTPYVTVASGGFFGLSAGNVQVPDIILTRDAANTLAQRNGVNAQAFNLYNTYTDASNYERGFMRFVSNTLRIGTEKLGTGAARALELHTDGVARLAISTNGNLFEATATQINLGSGTRLHSVGNGTFGISNSGNAAGQLLFGAFAAVTETRLKPSGTTLQVRLGNDSAFTNIQGKLTTEANAVSETITATHTITLYDAAGTAYKVPCVAA